MSIRPTMPLTPWGFPRRGAHRQRFLRAALDALHARLVEQGSGLLEIHGRPSDCLPALAAQVGAAGISCEAIAAPEEEAELAALRGAGIPVESVWQSSLLDPAALPFGQPPARRVHRLPPGGGAGRLTRRRRCPCRASPAGRRA
jgi:deoxyribodipyrimidine photolyase